MLMQHNVFRDSSICVSIATTSLLHLVYLDSAASSWPIAAMTLPTI